MLKFRFDRLINTQHSLQFYEKIARFVTEEREKELQESLDHFIKFFLALICFVYI